jgi:hypothetical protein
VDIKKIKDALELTILFSLATILFMFAFAALVATVITMPLGQ